MKRNMKKLAGLLVLLAGILTLTGCEQKAALPNEDTYKAKADQYVQLLAAMDEAALEEQIAGLEENFEDFEQEVAL